MSPPAITYSEDDIRHAVTDKAFQAGEIYQRQGRVLSRTVEADGILHARVLGNERKPYAQTIVVSASAGGAVAIEGACTCPVGLNCKHVAAALLEGLATGKASSAPPVSSRPVAAPQRTAPAPVAAGEVERLPPDLAGWLDELDRARATADENLSGLDHPAARLYSGACRP